MAPSHALLQTAKSLLQQATYVVALTGAGLSTRSGIPDFRSDAGLWDGVDPMAVASIQAFRRQPEKFYQWLRPLAQMMMQAKPNAAHHALASMEANGRLQAIITQNIDMLHSNAGSQNVYELHGHLRHASCPACQHVSEAAPLMQRFIQFGTLPHCPVCHTIVKPDVILFGELLPRRIMLQAQAAIQSCDLLIVAGSSLEVAPAGDLPRIAKANGARIIMVNYSATYLDSLADVVFHDDVATVLPLLAEQLENAG